jgi:hypothetical protein
MLGKKEKFIVMPPSRDKDVQKKANALRHPEYILNRWEQLTNAVLFYCDKFNLINQFAECV